MPTGTQKQLLGTETVRMLRAKGVNCRICGLSANNLEDSFLDAGADCFVLKPFPCRKDALESELIRITSTTRRRRKSANGVANETNVRET
jgi:DNA-binding response OmpR family regulator